MHGSIFGKEKQSSKNYYIKEHGTMNNNISLGKMFEIAGMECPEIVLDKKDEIISEIAVDSNWQNYNAPGLKVLVTIDIARTSLESFIRFVNDGVVIITYKPILDYDGKPLKVVVLSGFGQLRDFWLAFGRYYRGQFNIPTVAVTGSVGKTTTTEFLGLILKQKYSVFSTTGNLNNLEYIVREMCRGLNDSHTLHLQEIGGGVINSVNRVASMVKPDVFIISNVLPHHMNYYRSIENVESDKTSLDVQAKENAIGIINIDNEILRNHKFIHRIASCGIEHTEADYVAKNIHQIGAALEMDVVHNGNDVHLRVSIPGKHNAYNILLAYAAANEMGIDLNYILKGIESYRSGFIRQNLTVISGRTMLVDCFNHSIDSIKAALQFAQETEIPNGNRKIAVLGGENALGPNMFSSNYSLGLELDRYDKIDEFIFFGCPEGTNEKEVDRVGNAFAVYQGAKRSLRNRKISYCSSREIIAEKLIHETVPGDLIVLKGIIHYPLWPAVDIAFGAALTMRSGTVVVTNRVSEDSSSGYYYKYVEGVNLAVAPITNGTLTVPECIMQKPVFRIGRDAFKGRNDISDIKFGRSVQNIGLRSFFSCNNLTELFAPANILHIEEYAFSKCAKLQKAVFCGVEHISSNAFSLCPRLSIVEVPESCVYIADDAFRGCSRNLVIYGKNEYVRKWAETHKIQFVMT